MTPELAKVLNSSPCPDFTNIHSLQEEMANANRVVQTYLKPSPLRPSLWLSELCQADVYLKFENLNPNGSFKVRGALYAMHKRFLGKQAPFVVCAASAGNHAQGIAFAAKKMGAEAHIFLPKRTPIVKKSATERLGARVYLVGDVLEEAFEAAVAFARDQGAELIHAFNDTDIIIGQSTVAEEIFSELSQVDDIIVSIGGGGLAAGVGIRAHESCRIIGVEQEHFDSAYRSFKKGSQDDFSEKGHTTIADGIAVSRIGNVSFEFMKRYLERIHLVSDDDIVAAVLGLCEREHVVAEGAGAAAVAHLLKSSDLYAGRRVVAVVSGGNMDPQLLGRVIARGLGVTGRVLRITARLGDRPGQLRRLLEEIANLEANILEINHDRTYSKVHVGEVEVNISMETRDFEHHYMLMQRLTELEFKPRIWGD